MNKIDNIKDLLSSTSPTLVMSSLKISLKFMRTIS